MLSEGNSHAPFNACSFRCAYGWYTFIRHFFEALKVISCIGPVTFVHAYRGKWRVKVLKYFIRLYYFWNYPDYTLNFPPTSNIVHKRTGANIKECLHRHLRRRIQDHSYQVILWFCYVLFNNFTSIWHVQDIFMKRLVFPVLCIFTLLREMTACISFESQ